MNHDTPEPVQLAGDWPMIEAQLPRDWRELAQTHGAVPAAVPEQLGAKVGDASVPLRLIFHHVAANTSLKTTVAVAAAAGVVAVSAVALHKWMCKFGSFLAAMLVALTEAAQKFRAERWAGYDILTVDASTVCRPGSKGTTARIHYALRLSNLHPVHLDVTDDRGGESFRRFAKLARPGQLWLGDRGYANPPGIAAITARGAAVMVRYNRGSLPLYDVNGRPFDVLERLNLRLQRPGVPREWAVWVHPRDGERIRGRLCAVLLPADKVAAARERLQREQGSEVTAESLAMARFVAVFTTVPRDLLSTEQVLELYGLRWQVELNIKRDKSIAGLDRLPNFRDDTIRSWLLAKLLLIQIAHKIATPAVAFPPCAA